MNADRRQMSGGPTGVPMVVAVVVAMLAASCGDDETSSDRFRAVALMQNGLALAESGRLDSALATFERVVEIDSTISEAHYRVGMLSEYRGLPADAEKAYRRALRHDSTSDAAHLNLGQLLGQSARYDEALDHFRAALRHSSDRKVIALSHYCMGMTYGITGDAIQGAEAYGRATATDSAFARAYVGEGQELLRQGRAADAVPVLLKALELDSMLVDAHGYLGNAYRALGRMEEAEAAEARRQVLRQMRLDGRR